MRFYVLSLGLFLAAGCDEAGARAERERFDEVCNFQPESVDIGADRLCDEEGVHRFILFLSNRAAEPIKVVQVSLTQQGPGGRSFRDVTDKTDPMPLRLQAWLACEHRMERRPWIRLTFCARIHEAAGLKISVEFFGDHQRGNVYGEERVTPLLQDLLELRLTGVNRDVYRLTPTTFVSRPEVAGQGLVVENLLHVGGTQEFCPLGTRRREAMGECEPDLEARPTLPLPH